MGEKKHLPKSLARRPNRGNHCEPNPTGHIGQCSLEITGQWERTTGLSDKGGGEGNIHHSYWLLGAWLKAWGKRRENKEKRASEAKKHWSICSANSLRDGPARFSMTLSVWVCERVSERASKRKNQRKKARKIFVPLQRKASKIIQSHRRTWPKRIVIIIIIIDKTTMTTNNLLSTMHLARAEIFKLTAKHTSWMPTIVSNVVFYLLLIFLADAS